MNPFLFPYFRCYISCDPSFSRRARYAFTMLGLIEGVLPRFVDLPSDADICYSYEFTTECKGAWLPASGTAHSFLAAKNPFDAGTTAKIEWEGRTCLRLFEVDWNERHGVCGDIVSAAFFFLSLHEEWSSAERDQFGRFEAKNSLLGKLDMLSEPVVAGYAGVLGTLLKNAGFGVPHTPRFGKALSAVCVTHDIDYISKRTPGLLYRELVQYFMRNRIELPFNQRSLRLRQYLGFVSKPGSDPYRVSLSRMKDREEENGICGTWFFKAGGKDKRDVRYSLSHPFVQQALLMLRNAGHEIGIHPSFNAHEDAGMFGREKARLDGHGESVRVCRQHYLRFLYPGTWRIQHRMGITVDSTLGFAEMEGFRNGTCHPFMPYDLENEKVIPLWEMPLVAMDGTLAFYRGLDAIAAEDRIRHLSRVIADNRGVSAFLFHNVVYDRHDFPGWDGVFDRFAQETGASGAMTKGVEATVSAWLGGMQPEQAAVLLAGHIF